MPVEFTLKFAIVEAARRLLHTAPFTPFMLKLHDGTLLDVPNPDVLSVTLSGWVIHDDGTTQHILNPALIAELRQPSPASSKS